MKIKIFITGAIFLSFLLAVLYDMTTVPDAGNMPEDRKAPYFPFTTIDDRELDVADLKGKVVLLNFWASWCLPCLAEFPAMLRLVERFDGQVILLALSKDDNEDDIHRFLKKFPQRSDNILVVWDQNKEISEKIFNVMRVPETIIIDPNSVMKRKIIGAPPVWESREMSDYIEGLL